MKGIEAALAVLAAWREAAGSDHCPAMKGIEDELTLGDAPRDLGEATTAPQ